MSAFTLAGVFVKCVGVGTLEMGFNDALMMPPADPHTQFLGSDVVLGLGTACNFGLLPPFHYAREDGCKPCLDLDWPSSSYTVSQCSTPVDTG